MNRIVTACCALLLLTACWEENPLEKNRGKASEWLNEAPMTSTRISHEEIDTCMKVMLENTGSSVCNDFFAEVAKEMNGRMIVPNEDIRSEHFHSKIFWEQMAPLRAKYKQRLEESQKMRVEREACKTLPFDAAVKCRRQVYESYK